MSLLIIITNYKIIYNLENFLILTIMLTIILHIFGECPKPEILNPCTCVKDNIYCGGSNSTELKNIFHQMSTKLENGKKIFRSI
jgi:hypothetical protein